MSTKSPLVTKRCKEVLAELKLIANDEKRLMSIRARAVIMIGIIKRIMSLGVTQVEAAKLCALTQPATSNLVNGKIELFSLDRLYLVACRLGISVKFTTTSR